MAKEVLQKKRRPNTLYQVPFLCGDGTEAVILEVRYISGFPRGGNGTCAFCNGDPCAEDSKPETNIGAYFARNKWAETCPCCKGQAT